MKSSREVCGSSGFQEGEIGIEPHFCCDVASHKAMPVSFVFGCLNQR